MWFAFFFEIWSCFLLIYNQNFSLYLQIKYTCILQKLIALEDEENKKFLHYCAHRPW